MRRAVGTTYTLDLITLLTAPLAFTFFDAHDEDGVPVTDPVALLEALRRHAEKVTLFCQAGAIGVPRPEQTLLAYLEGSVIEVQPRHGGGIFHPKVWVLDFEADDAPAIYRVLCLSRNLTFARAWDTCLCLEGRLTERQRGYGRNKPFADLLRALPGLATRPIPAGRREDLEQMADAVRTVDFRPPRPFTDFRVHHFGLRGRRGWPFATGGRSLVMSPYLVGSTVRELVRDNGLEVLISRPEAFEEVVRSAGREALPRTCYVLSPGANLDSREAGEEEEEEEEEPSRRTALEDQVELAGLHAKLFLFENGREARLFTGSANATLAAFQGNVEVLVELIGKAKDCGIASLLGPDDDPRLERLRSLLQEYRPPDDLESDGNGERELERKADRLARMLGATCLIATVVDEGQRWDMTLSGELPEIPVGAEVRVWPATLSAEAALRIDGPANVPGAPADAAHPIATFRGLSFEALTAFFAFEVCLREGQHEVRQRFAVTGALVGAPEDRKERLLRSLLKDRRRVLRLLFLILMDEGADVSAFVEAAGRGETAPARAFASWNQEALLETLLRSLSRNPERIDQAARLLADLGSTPEGEELLPEGLNEIWEPVWATREALRS